MTWLAIRSLFTGEKTSSVQSDAANDDFSQVKFHRSCRWLSATGNRTIFSSLSYLWINLCTYEIKSVIYIVLFKGKAILHIALILHLQQPGNMMMPLSFQDTTVPEDHKILACFACLCCFCPVGILALIRSSQVSVSTHWACNYVIIFYIIAYILHCYILFRGLIYTSPLL